LVPGADPEVCKSLAQDIASFVQDRAFAGWTTSTSARQEVGREINRLLLGEYQDLGLYPGPFQQAALDYVVQHYETVGAGA